MNFLTNINIGKRLGIGFALVLSLTLLITGAAIWRMSANADATSAMMVAPLAKERLITEWHTQTYAAVRRTAAIVKSSDQSLVDFFKEDNLKTSGRTSAVIKRIEPLLEGEQERAQFKHINDLRQRYTEAKNKAVKARSTGDAAGAEQILNSEYMPAADAYESAVADLVKMQQNNIDATANGIRDSNRASMRLLTALSLGAVALGAACAWLMASSITRPIRAAVELAETVAAGNLTRTIDVQGKDETGALLRALRQMNDNLARIVGQVRSGTATIATASAEIAAGNHDLSSRTEQQAGSLEETAAAVEELTSTVRQNADNARQANALSLVASRVAADGGAVVAEVVQTMGSIHASSKKIVEIISVIDGIAFQTNILALNAAVEAARAGEQGRGFAVVAGEVRTLAQRSAAAAKEIKSLIDDSVGKVDAGARLVDRAGVTMEQVVDSIRKVTGIVGEISSASVEQSAGIEQLNGAIADMDASTQHNAALVEQSAAAASALQEQAAKLAQMVSVFETGAPAAAHAVAVPVRTAAPAARVRAAQAPVQAPVRANMTRAGTPEPEWETF